MYLSWSQSSSFAAAAAEGAQQSNKQQYDMLHPLFCRQVGRAPATVGRACALPGPTLATPLFSTMSMVKPQCVPYHEYETSLSRMLSMQRVVDFFLVKLVISTNKESLYIPAAVYMYSVCV